MKFGIILIIAIAIGIFLLTPSAWNPLTPKGQVIGIFVYGGHHGYGNECGEYPGSFMWFRKANYDSKHWHGENGSIKTYFGNQFKDVDKMIVGEAYRVWYHEGSRQSDVSANHNIYFWVVDGYEMLHRN